MAVPAYRAEVWQLPHIDPWTKILPRLRFNDLSMQIELSDVGYGRLSFIGTETEISSIIDTTNGVGSVLRVFDDTNVNVFSSFCEFLDQTYQEDGLTAIHGPGLANILDKMVVWPWDGIDGVNPDWIWGGPNLIPPLGISDLGNIAAVWHVWIERETYGLSPNSTDGTFSLTVNGNTTDPIDFDASGGTVQNQLEDLPGISSVSVEKFEDDSYLIVFLNPLNLATDMTFTDIDLNGTPDFNKISDGFDNTGPPTFTLTVDSGADTDTTDPMAYNISAASMSNILEFTLDNIEDVTVSGNGIRNIDPWVITFFTPALIDSVTGTFAAGTIDFLEMEEGRLDPSPVGLSQRVDQRIDPDEHGTYGSPAVQVITDPALVRAGSDWTLLVRARSRFAGSQILLNVNPGMVYQASIWVRPTVTAVYRIVVRDIFENEILIQNYTLTAGVYTEMTLANIQIPPGVTTIVFRVGVVDQDPATWVDHYVDWQSATFYEGMPPTTTGEIVLTFIQAAQARGVGVWLRTASFTFTTDSGGVAWVEDEISVTIPAGQTVLQVLDALLDHAGIHWFFEWNEAESAYDLLIWNRANAATDRSATLTFHPRIGWTGAQYQESLPPYTAVLGEGDGPIWSEAADVGMVADFGRWEGSAENPGVGISTVTSLDIWLARQLSDILTHRFAIRATSKAAHRYGTDFKAGDIVNFAFPNTPVGTKSERLASVMIAISGSDEQSVQYAVDFVKPVLIEDIGGTTSAPTSYVLNKFLRKFRRKIRPARSVPPVLGSGKAPTLVLSASNSSQFSKDRSDFILNETLSPAELQTVLDDILSLTGGRLLCTEGDFNYATTNMAWPASVAVEGAGRGVTLFRVQNFTAANWTMTDGGMRDLTFVQTLTDT